MVELRARRAALRSLYSGRADARRFVTDGWCYLLLIHVQLALVVAGRLPRWTLLALLPIWMARLMIGQHELIHLRHERDLDWLTRLWPVLAMVTPFSLGYREHRQLHRLHHQYLLTDGDPDHYQIRGSRLAGFLNCFTSPEQDLFRWVRAHGVDRALLADFIARSACFVALSAISGRMFLWYWAPLRVTYGCALFLFSYLLHRRGARYGVFRIELGPVGVRLFCLIFGRTGWLAVCNHDVHHLNSNISALRLLEARGVVEEPGRCAASARS